LESYNNFVKRFKFLKIDNYSINEANKSIEKDVKIKENKELKNNKQKEIDKYLRSSGLDSETLKAKEEDEKLKKEEDDLIKKQKKDLEEENREIQKNIRIQN
jgi:hypothetical protein